MQKLILAAVATASLSLAGCATPGAGPGSTPSANDILAQVQAYTQQACGFLPLVSSATVSSLLVAFFPQGVGVQQAVSVIGAAICAGTSPRTLGRSAAKGATVYKMVQTPKGAVRVPGKFVR